MVVLREKQLLVGFGIVIVITVSIGLIGILQINALTQTIQALGQRHLPRESLILQMKENNALYAMGVRNYVFWRVSKYLQSASIASDINFIKKSAAEFSNSILEYQKLIDSTEQENWILTIKDSTQQLSAMGNRLIELIDIRSPDKDKINQLLMTFENKFYEIDEFLSGTLSKNNLASIKKQLKIAQGQKQTAITVLIISLCISVVLGVIISFLVYRSLHRERIKREELTNVMLSMEERERKNLSRQIHDQLSQDLSALKIYLDLMEQNISQDNTSQKEKLQKSKKILSDLMEKGHNISELLRPPELDELGVAESITALVKEHQEITGCQCNYKKPQQELKCSAEYSLTLYRIVQEALTNSAKYAQAKYIEVSLSQILGNIKLVVFDDGVGFEYVPDKEIPHRRKEDKLKLGLQGLRERVELLGGTFAIRTAHGRGTKIEVTLKG
ncbi:MAG: ATP-binding protein [Candidatus Omnitrophota bacterium]